VKWKYLSVKIEYELNSSKPTVCFSVWLRLFYGVMILEEFKNANEIYSKLGLGKVRPAAMLRY
jgi:hypothetical protein